MQMQIGFDVINSYKRLSYSPWHAIAEFVDNSTQAYFNNRKELDEIYKKEGSEEKLHVSIVYDREKDGGFLRVFDNAIGMSEEELENALHVALPPQNTSGRSKYGMGMKTAACWIGNKWKIKTKKLGETVEHAVEVDVAKIASGNNDLIYSSFEGKGKDEHHTIIEITNHNRKFQGRTIGKIRQYLSSMYREDFRNAILILEWQGSELDWEELDDNLLKSADGTSYQRSFNFTVDKKKVEGWVGILDRGSRSQAGFSILHSGRVVRGWPDSWRPSSLYGQVQGSNDLVNQRLVGEIHLDAFEVSHTKDDILWLGSQEEDVERDLKKHCIDYRRIAQQRRKGTSDSRGPTEVETNAAIDELKRELTSAEMVDQVSIEPFLPKEAVQKTVTQIKESVVSTREATFSADLGSLTVKGYIVGDMSPNDPYVLTDSAKEREVIVIVNTHHPHWSYLKGSEGVLNYLRHCTYDAMAEWQARFKTSSLDPDTVKLLKDKFLRVPLEIEMHSDSEEEDVED